MAKKILIVDDQEDILLILEREFRRVPGFSMLTASKYLDALSLVVDQPVDFVISDVRIGSTSGFDLIREIKKIRPEAGSILMSAYRSSSNRQQAKELGVYQFLEKPFPLPRLVQEVGNYFAEKEKEKLPPPVEPPTAEQDSGGLVHFKLQDLVQLFCLNGRNILITVAPGPEGPVGEIYIQRGQVIHADYRDQTGESGFQAMMQIKVPVLKVKDWAEPVPVTIQTTWVRLLLESAMHADTQEIGLRVKEG